MDMNRKIVNQAGWGFRTISEVKLLLKGIVSRADNSGKKLSVNLSSDERILLEFLVYSYDWSLPYGGELTTKKEE